MPPTLIEKRIQIRDQMNRRVERLLLQESYKLEHGYTTLSRLSKQKAACGLTPATLGVRARKLGIKVHKGRSVRSPLAALRTDLAQLRRIGRRIEKRLGQSR